MRDELGNRYEKRAKLVTLPGGLEFYSEIYVQIDEDGNEILEENVADEEERA